MTSCLLTPSLRGLCALRPSGRVAARLALVVGAALVACGPRRLPTPTPAELTRCDEPSKPRLRSWPKHESASLDPEDWCTGLYNPDQIQALRCGEQRVVRVSFDDSEGVDLFYKTDGELAGRTHIEARRSCLGVIPSTLASCAEEGSLDCLAWRREHDISNSPPPRGIIGDPGWGYRAPGGQAVMDRGLYWVMPAVGGVGVSIHGSVFAGTMSLSLDLTNEADTPLEVLPDQVAVGDVRGRDPRFRPGPLPAQCKSGKTVLAKGERCEIDLRMNAPPDPVRMRALTVIHSGVRRGNEMIPIKVSLVINKH